MANAIEQGVRRSLEKGEAQDPEFRVRIYEAAERAILRVGEEKGLSDASIDQQIQRLITAIEKIEAEYPYVDPSAHEIPETLEADEERLSQEESAGERADTETVDLVQDRQEIAPEPLAADVREPDDDPDAYNSPSPAPFSDDASPAAERENVLDNEERHEAGEPVPPSTHREGHGEHATEVTPVAARGWPRFRGLSGMRGRDRVTPLGSRFSITSGRLAAMTVTILALLLVIAWFLSTDGEAPPQNAPAPTGETAVETTDESRAARVAGEEWTTVPIDLASIAATGGSLDAVENAGRSATRLLPAADGDGAQFRFEVPPAALPSLTGSGRLRLEVIAAAVGEEPHSFAIQMIFDGTSGGRKRVTASATTQPFLYETDLPEGDPGSVAIELDLTAGGEAGALDLYSLRVRPVA